MGWQTGYISFHVALDNPVLDGLKEDDVIRLEHSSISGLFEIDIIDRRGQMHEGVLCAVIRLKEYAIKKDYDPHEDKILDAKNIE